MAGMEGSEGTTIGERDAHDRPLGRYFCLRAVVNGPAFPPSCAAPRPGKGQSLTLAGPASVRQPVPNGLVLDPAITDARPGGLPWQSLRRAGMDGSLGYWPRQFGAPWFGGKPK
jgi:hypothetical protein